MKFCNPSSSFLLTCNHIVDISAPWQKHATSTPLCSQGGFWGTWGTARVEAGATLLAALQNFPLPSAFGLIAQHCAHVPCGFRRDEGWPINFSAFRGDFSPAGATEPSAPSKHTGTENRHLQAPSAFPTSRPAMISPGLPCPTLTLLPSNPQPQKFGCLVLHCHSPTP